MCTKNHGNLMYSSWATGWDGQNFLSFWAIFYPFVRPPSPLTTRKIKIWKYEKKPLEISCIPKITIIWYMLPEIRSATDRIFLSFWAWSKIQKNTECWNTKSRTVKPRRQNPEHQTWNGKNPEHQIWNSKTHNTKSETPIYGTRIGFSHL